MASPWQPGSHVYAQNGRRLTLGTRIDLGANAEVFELREFPGEVAKIYTSRGSRPDIDLLGRHLRRALGDVTAQRPESPLVARPTYELYDRANARVAVGFMMHHFASEQGWMSLHDTRTRPDLSQAPSWCLQVARQIARDVAYFHRMSLVVGDLSDTNIRVTERGDVCWIDVDSFGALSAGGLDAVSAFGSTPECRAPELMSGREPASIESDRFALALQLLRLLTCQFVHPYAIESRSATSARSVDERIEDGDSWIVEPAKYKTGAVAHRGVSAWPSDLDTCSRNALGGGPRPDAGAWVAALSAVTPTHLEEALAGPSPTAEAPSVPTPSPPRSIDNALPLGVRPAGVNQPPAGGTQPPGHRWWTGPLRSVAVVAGVATVRRSRRWWAVGLASAAVLAGAMTLVIAGGGPDPSPAKAEVDSDVRPASKAERALNRVLPAGVSDCTYQDPAAVRVRATASCKSDGVSSIKFRLFRTGSQLERQFRRDAARLGANPGKRPCSVSAPRMFGWTRGRPTASEGLMVCYLSGGIARVSWTDMRNLLYVETVGVDGDIGSLDKLWRGGAFG